MAGEASKVTDSVPDSSDTTWSGATKQARDAAVWVIGALAAVAVVVFGAGPLIQKTDLSWSDNATQLVVIWISGVIGLLAVIYLIGLVSRVLQPQPSTLTDLPPSFVAKIDAEQSRSRGSLPASCASFEEFVQRLPDRRREPAGLRAEVARAESNLASAAGPGNVQAAEDVLSTVRQMLATSTENAARYEVVAKELRDRAAYDQVSTLTRSLSTKVLSAAVIAAVAGITFQLALSHPAEASGSDAPSASPADGVAYLIRPADDAPGAALWTQLSLDLCAVGDKVPAVVNSGPTTGDGPWTVTVLALNSDCRIITFQTSNELIAVELPEPAVVVTVTPTPTLNPNDDNPFT